MKILVLGHSIGHYRQRAMWEWIAEQGHRVNTMVMPQYQDEKYAPIERDSFKQNLVTIHASPISNFWYFTSLHEYIHQLNPDVVFCYQEPWNVSAYMAMMMTKMFKKPFGFFTWENMRRLLPNPYRRIMGDVVHGSDLIVGGNSDAAKIMMEMGGDFIVKELQTGLDTNLFVPIPRLNFDERIEPIKLLFVGRLVKEKGIEVILKAFEKLEGDYVLKFVGGRGEMGELITQHKEYGKKIILEPWTEYTKLPQIYNWADITLMPSIDSDAWIEQCGYVAGESLLCHVPVITTFSRSIVEWWKLPDVEFIPQGDIDLLVDKIEEMSKNLHEAKEGRKAVVSKYSNKTIGQNYLDMFEEIK